MKKDLLKMQDLSKDELMNLLELAEKLKYEKKHGIPHEILKGKTLGMIFEKSSTRTRISFETGIYQLGGTGLFLSSKETQLGRGEPIKDTARVLSRYLDGIMIRTFGQEIVEELAEYASIPVINALTDYAHPCQVLADLLTIKEYKGGFDGKKMCFIGDGNNMANSLIVGGLLAGMGQLRLQRRKITVRTSLYLTLPQNTALSLRLRQVLPTPHAIPTPYLPTYGRAWAWKAKLKRERKILPDSRMKRRGHGCRKQGCYRSALSAGSPRRRNHSRGL